MQKTVLIASKGRRSDMNNKNVCQKCGQIYDSSLTKCPLCGAAAPAPEAEPASKSSEGGKFLSKDDRKALKHEEESFLRSEESRYSRMKRRGDADPAPEDDETDTRIPAGFIVASVIVLLAALVIGGSFLLWKTGVANIGIYDRLSGKTTEPTTQTQPSELPQTDAPVVTDEPAETLQTDAPETTAPTEPPVELPFDFDPDDPVLVLVNDDNPIPDDYPVDDMATLGTGAMVNRLCMDDLQQMVSDCRNAIHYPAVCNGYDEKAKDTSEYRTGIAVDIFPESDRVPDVATQKESETLMWLWEHCWEYGFVVRYPEGKEDLTGHDFEPWHFRYVGKDVAEYMHENDLCFEEMADLLSRAAG